MKMIRQKSKNHWPISFQYMLCEFGNGFKKKIHNIKRNDFNLNQRQIWFN